jgi:preprotein translocase subunit YajC
MHLNEILVLAQATAPAAASSGTSAQQSPPNLLNMLPMLVLFGVIFYFLMIRPQSQQRKKQAQLLETLKSGDKVVTSSGIVGVVITVKDNTVSIRSADAKMEVTKASVVQILEGSAAIES